MKRSRASTALIDVHPRRRSQRFKTWLPVLTLLAIVVVASSPTTSTASAVPSVALGTQPITPVDTDAQANFISCPSTTTCIALGTSGWNEGNLLPWIATLVNGAWTAQTGPVPPDATTGDPGVQIDGLSCTDPGSCVAVGTYQDLNNVQKGLFLLCRMVRGVPRRRLNRPMVRQTVRLRLIPNTCTSTPFHAGQRDPAPLLAGTCLLAASTRRWP